MEAILMHDDVKKVLTNALVKALEKAFGENPLSDEEVYSNIGHAPKKEMGDFAFACFPLAKSLRKGPPQIAQELQKNLENLALIEKSVPMGPYLNFFINPGALAEILGKQILSGSYFQKKLLPQTFRAMVEYSQPNTHKELHVGHMRNLCLGSALINSLKYAGHEVIAVTYPGDVGTHVAKCLWYLKYHNQDPIPKEDKGAWLGQIYSKAHLKLEDEKGTDKEAENRTNLTEILTQLHGGNGEYFDLWQETRKWSLDLMKEIYEWANVTFDRWYFESEVDAESVKMVKDLFEQGKLVKSEGAIGMDLSEEKLGFCLLLKTDGTGLYATKDVLLAYKKFEEFQMDKNLYVVDKRQALHFQQVFAVLKRLGFKNADQCEHIQYDFVELPDGAMSSRKGNIVPLEDLIHQMVNLIKDGHLKKYESEWSKEQIETVANQVAQGAIKYGMLKTDSQKKIVFDMQEWLKLDGESGPYLQYSFARISSMVEKLLEGELKDIKWSTLSHASEKNLLVQLTEFNQVVLVAQEQHRPSHICNYLYDLSKAFNSFYAACSVKNAENEDLKHARLALSQMVALTLKQGLSLLGIPAPERM